ncbi:STAS domain-containing protein [Nonomuraea gerenzanensis]|uniref:Anti-sigma factor antagonist n=1 Tax=Nonomuraea gerenzanensis TaxID=93944 RepID=A0A1M4EAG1_9ACTN|nr:STAS domain-containing protein [Nonomuraea gerenzanensis]UBU17811.1 STAS domain-containing protein [Nonomuraea gerenzanensis]SBO95593.1 hypothetical protein BN4615_P5109 [Nonomuraea gerenzanensis]
MPALSLSSRELPGGVLITVTGELDSTNADQLESYADRHRGPGPGLILDLNELTFMDSRGLHVLLRLNAAVRRQGGLLRLAGVQDVPARVLQITGVWLALHIHPDAQHAAAAMRDHRTNGVARPS